MAGMQINLILKLSSHLVITCCCLRDSMAAMAATATQPTISDHDRLSMSKLLKHFQYNPERDSPSDVRNVLLVVAALIAATTFAAGVNPPGGVWQESIDSGKNAHAAGMAVLASSSSSGAAFTMFLFFNSAAFSSSTLVISFLVYDFPFYLEIWVALFSMSCTYGASISTVSHRTDVDKICVFLALGLPYILRFLVEQYKKKCK